MKLLATRLCQLARADRRSAELRWLAMLLVSATAGSEMNFIAKHTGVESVPLSQTLFSPVNLALVAATFVTLPLLFQSRVMTHVQIQDGMTVVLGQQGFMASNERMSGVPIFGDIPVLGSFFKNEQNQRDDRNLLIFLTPRILDLRE